ncbi:MULTISPECIES: AraC family transcriptional regulator [Rhodomicrobium]|uniref:helix-turn-helix domain-containing protein n=1 Tax=Rhodomicrobium TaxID=1068 RepID=UPI001FDA95F7|nr:MULTISPECIES: AraC family transcriptional regulator [Rhodomicrobium]
MPTDLNDEPDEQTIIGEFRCLMDVAPPLAPESLGGDTRLTPRWTLGAVDHYVPGMSAHVVKTYYGAERETVWRRGGVTLSGLTRPGTITLIPKGHDGHWYVGGQSEMSHIFLTERRLRSWADQIAGGRRVELVDRLAFEDGAAARILELLAREAAQSDPAARLFVEQAIDLLCTQLIRRHCVSSGLGAPAPNRGGLADWQVKRVTAYMIEHLDKTIGLDELAGLVKLSRFHFCTSFRVATGRTPHEWLTQQRMDRARGLLADASLRITDVALAVGYQTPSAFTASFRKFTGVTPSEYRRRQL